MEIVLCPDPGCGSPAEVVDRWTLESTDGPVAHVTTRCVCRHVFTPRVSTLRSPAGAVAAGADRRCTGSG
jgi:hypothetical protein